jgi:hypothetical protein
MSAAIDMASRCFGYFTPVAQAGELISGLL